MDIKRKEIVDEKNEGRLRELARRQLPKCRERHDPPTVANGTDQFDVNDQSSRPH